MSAETDSKYDLTNLDLPNDQYEVVQGLIRSKYKATDGRGNVVLRGKQKMLKMKEEFPFYDGQDEHVMTVKAGGILDVAGDYTLTDEATGEPIVVLDAKYSWFGDTWKIRDPDDERLLATIESKSTVADVLRSIHPILGLIPHKYEITDADGGHVGSIEGTFSLKDKYSVRIDDASAVPREAVLAAAMVVDAIEGN
jgi:uncharacterized protein YxjI